MAIDLRELCAGRAVLTDGAMGTELARRGLGEGVLAELWNVENARAVAGVHKAYAEAGSEVVLSNTFQANRIVLEGHGLAGRVEDFNKAGVELAGEAVGSDVLVFGSVGPSGKLLMVDEIGEDDLIRAFGQQIKALSEAGAKAIVLETFADPLEAVAAVKAAKDNCDLPVVASFSFAAGAENDRTIMGANAEQIVAELGALGVAGFGANCGVGSEMAGKLAQRYREVWDGPVWIKPNAGLPQLIEGKTVFSVGPSEFAEQMQAAVEAGASFVGGCCGSTPGHIEALGEILKK